MRLEAGATQQIDWQEWSRRWDAQQTFLVVRREERFQVMFALAEQLLGSAPKRVLDLACGTGDVARRVLERFPSAQVVGLDADPLLLAIAEGALGEAGGRALWVRADLRDPSWPAALSEQTFDLVVSSTALHWLPTQALIATYRALYDLVAPAGVVLNADVIPPQVSGKLATAADQLRTAAAREAQAASRGERWAEWWDAAKREPALAGLLREREQLFEDHPDDCALPSVDLHLDALRDAGFAEAALMWRFFDYGVVAAVK